MDTVTIISKRRDGQMASWRFFLVLMLLWGFPLARSQAEEVCPQAKWRDVAARLQALFEAAPPPEPVLIEELANGNEEGGVIGFYRDQGAEMHVTCSIDDPGRLAATVRHEYTHHYLHRDFGFVPLWLDEGLATYMEAGSLDEGTLADHVNVSRLREYVQLLKWGKVPGIQTLVSGKPTGLSRSQYYAVSWGLVFSLMHDPDPSVQKRHRALVKSMLETIRDHGRDGARMADGMLLQSLSGEDGDLAEWELRWHRRLWDLQP